MIQQCVLCPKSCIIKPGQTGECLIRANIDGNLTALTYGYPCSVHVDPVEKKPLFHFHPGKSILSIATAGCNLHCKNCQNWEISQANPEDIKAYHLPPEKLPSVAKYYGCELIAYTYTEPLIFYEYTLDTSINAAKIGLKNVLVTAGYLNREPLRQLYRYISAANIDLKAFSEKFYRDNCGATLKPVLDGMILAKSMGVMVEITNLIIPALNDSEKEIKLLSKWIKENLGPETPLHFSRFSPHYRMKNLGVTPAETLEKARQTALSEGLYYVYTGNMLSKEGENTYCHKCSTILIERRGYRILKNKIAVTPSGTAVCPVCETEVYGEWI
ncbi:MAG: AmmeMemoRadiSam system radical SAM enzyme [bacterium]|nr:AmmeMemoRadiSam system radical SAM enzyme [bacterium]